MSYKVVRARREALRAIAREMGLAFFPEYDPRLKLSSKLWRCQVYNQRNQLAFHCFDNIMVARDGRIDLTAMDFSYGHWPAEDESTHDAPYANGPQSLVLIETDSAHLPAFCLRPIQFTDRLVRLIPGLRRGIEFRSHPDFSKRYLLRGEDEPAIREAFTSDVLDHFYTESVGWPRPCVEVVQRNFVYYRQKLWALATMDAALVPPEEVSDFIKEAIRAWEVFRFASIGDDIQPNA